jgi:hypothetical protein
VNRLDYLAAVLRIFLAQPGAPHRASRHDWAVAQSLFARGVPLDHFRHAVQLATLRRLHAAPPTLPPVRSLAYYRAVLDRLSPDEFLPGYRRYVATRYAELFPQRAPTKPKSRAS